MSIPLNNIIQIAGVIDKKEAEMLSNFDIDFLGLPLGLKEKREDISIKGAQEIIGILPTRIKPVLITYLDNAKEVNKLVTEIGVDIVQLHGNIKLDEITRLKQINSNIRIIKSLIVKKNNFDTLKKMVIQYSSFVDAFLTDTYDRTTGLSGATGKTHNWMISRQIVELSHRPVILAGRLRPDNVENAILLQILYSEVLYHFLTQHPPATYLSNLVRSA